MFEAGTSLNEIIIIINYVYDYDYDDDHDDHDGNVPLTFTWDSRPSRHVSDQAQYCTPPGSQ